MEDVVIAVARPVVHRDFRRVENVTQHEMDARVGQAALDVPQARLQLARKAIRLLIYKYDIGAIAHDRRENQLTPQMDDLVYIQIQKTDAKVPQFRALETGQLDVIDARLNAETLQHGRSAHDQDGQVPNGIVHVLAYRQCPPDVSEPERIM